MQIARGILLVLLRLMFGSQVRFDLTGGAISFAIRITVLALQQTCARLNGGPLLAGRKRPFACPVSDLSQRLSCRVLSFLIRVIYRRHLHQLPSLVGGLELYSP